MSSISKWTDETETPYLSKNDRLIALLYDLGITTLEQLVTLTGWSKQQVDAGLRSIRQKVSLPERLKLDYQKVRKMNRLKKAKTGQLKLKPTELAQLQQQVDSFDMSETDWVNLEAVVTDKLTKIDKERNQWLVIYRPDKHKESFYTLGSTGVAYACSMREEPVSKWKVSPKNQMVHFTGTNEILCRLRRAGIEEEEFLCSRETAQELYYYFERYKKKKKSAQKDTLYCRPDAYLKVREGEDYFLEFDTGHEKPARLKKRFKNYLKLYEALALVNSPMQLPVIWVVKNEKRKKEIEKIAKEVLADWQTDNPAFDAESLPASVCFVAGDDTKFLLGQLEADPFW